MKKLETNVVTVKAPGKLMLLGEHAVVYGYPCIVTTVDRYMTVTIEERDNRDEIQTGKHDDRLVKAAIHSFRKKYGTNGFIRVVTESEITGYGLGSSAAVVVATIKGLALLFGKNINNEELFSLAFEAVRTVQPRASGFDLASCIWGGTILFDGKTKRATPIYNGSLPLMVAYSGVKANTVEMVKQVAKSRDSSESKKRINQIFIEIAAIVKKGREAVVKNDWESLGELFNKNHSLLKQLRVSTEKIDRLVEAARKARAWGAKLSGAGGGDCIIALVPEEKRVAVTNALTEAGGEVLDVRTGVGGAQVINPKFEYRISKQT